MDFSKCKQCGIEIEGKGIQFRGQSFCGEECCEVFEEKNMVVDEPDFGALEEEDLELESFDDEGDEEGLGYDSDPTEEKRRSPLDEDDDFEIDPDDF